MNKNVLTYWENNYRFTVSCVVIFIITQSFPNFSLFEERAASMLQIHLLEELFAVIVAILIAVISWYDLKNNANSKSGILLAGFTIVAIMDLVHALTYDGMPKLIIENSTHRAIFFWLAGRAFVALTLALIVQPIQFALFRRTWLFMALLVSAVIVWIGTVKLDWVPNTFVPKLGVTPFKIRCEYFLSGIDMLLFLVFIYQATEKNRQQFFAFASACLVMALGELMFTGYTAPSDFHNIFGHTFKILSYGFLYRHAFVSAVELPYQRLFVSERLLQASEERFALAMQGANDGLWDWNLETDEVYYSPRWKEMLGFRDDEIEHQLDAGLMRVHPNDRARVLKAIDDYTSGHSSSFSIEMRMRHKDGHWINILSRAFLVRRKSDGHPLRLVGTHVDITDHKQLEESLQLYSLIYQSSAEAVMVTDSNNRIVAVNPAFSHDTGYTLEEVVGKNPKLLKSGHHDKDFYREMWSSLLKKGQWQGELWDRRKDGSDHIKFANISVIRNADGSIYRHVSQFYDITEKKQSEELIWRQANFDVLTGLPNRSMFQDRFNQEIKKSHRTGLPIALLFIDLDHFKEINDTLGHSIGDLLIKEASQRLVTCVREPDTVARFGGDEFTILLAEMTDPSCIAHITQDILKKLAKPFQLGHEIAYVSASIGIALYPEDASNIEELLKNADQAMYQAKDAGRNRFCYFTAVMQEAAQTRMRITNELREALGKNQLWVAYQPIVELATGHIHKAESLIRWRHPTRGLISPAEFIPIAENSGLIVEIGEWIFRKAADQTKHWRALIHPNFQISVNKSPVQFYNTDSNRSSWLDYMQSIGLPGLGITVEITEGLLLDANTIVTDRLLELRDAGIEVSLDDFGTGYSSLSYLKKFDIDYLKIDQSFVRTMTSDSNDMVLCEAIIVMAHKLNIKVIAEGIETVEQRDMLLAAGCDYGQGYLFSKPVPAEEFEALIKG